MKLGLIPVRHETDLLTVRERVQFMRSEIFDTDIT